MNRLVQYSEEEIGRFLLSKIDIIVVVVESELMVSQQRCPRIQLSNFKVIETYLAKI